MAVFNGVFPILPGKEQGGRDFAAAITVSYTHLGRAVSTDGPFRAATHPVVSRASRCKAKSFGPSECPDAQPSER